MKLIISTFIFVLSAFLLQAQTTKFHITGGHLNVNGTTKIVLNNAKWVNDGAFDAGNSEVELSGNSVNSTIGGTSATTFHQLKVNKSSNDALLEKEITVTDKITLTSGKLSIDDYDLSMSNISSIANVNNDRYIKTDGTGKLIRQVDASNILFPIGNESYTPVTLNNIGTIDDFGIRIENIVYENGVSGNEILENIVDATWHINEGTSGGSDLTLTFQWNASDELSNFDRTQSFVSYYDNSMWNNGSVQAAAGSDPHTLSVSNISNFSPFIVADDIIQSSLMITACPSNQDIESCGITSITNGGLTALPYSTFEVIITETQFNNEGGAIMASCTPTIKYKDSKTGTCPIVVTRTFTIIDNCSNSEICTQILNINDTTDPGVTCKDATIELDGSGNVTLSQFKVYNSTTDNCGIKTLSVSPNIFSCMDIGSHTVVLTATDYCDNSDDCIATVTIEDNAPPVARCKNHTVQLNSSGVGTLSVSDVDDGSSDNCGIANSSIDLPSSFDCDDIGVHLATLSLTDINGNSSSCTANVTVADDVDPQAKCKDFTITCPGGLVTINTMDVDDGSSDNCTFSLSLDQTTLPCSNVPITVKMTATDDSGNIDNCTSVVSFNVQTGTTALSINNVSELEGDWFGFTFFIFEVERTGGIGAVSVDYSTADGTATLANNDYIPLYGTLNWANGGSNIQTFPMLIRKDNIPEADEIFYVNLSNPTGAIISNGQGEAEILDDDSPPPSPIIGNEDGLAQNQLSISKNRPTIFPNPAKEELFISLPSDWIENTTQRVMLFDNSGRKIMEYQLSELQSRIDINEFRNGLYHLVFYKKDGGIVTEKFIKQ